MPTPKFSVSEIVHILNVVKAERPDDWDHAHRKGHPKRYNYIIHAGTRLYEVSGGTVGLNWRRAVEGDLSMDGISIEGEDGLRYFADVISGAGGPNPSIPSAIRLTDRDLLRDPAGNYAPHGFASPADLIKHGIRPVGSEAPQPAPSPEPEPPHVCPPCPPIPTIDRAELLDEASFLDAFYRAPEGLQREQGLSIGGRPDWEGVAAWLFDVYLNARLRGKSRLEARTDYVMAIQKTPEWQEKHR